MNFPPEPPPDFRNRFIGSYHAADIDRERYLASVKAYERRTQAEYITRMREVASQEKRIQIEERNCQIMEIKTYITALTVIFTTIFGGIITVICALIEFS